MNGTFRDYAAYGITRQGNTDGTVRTISMAGFGAAAISQVTGKPCYADSYQDNWEGYCDCLFPRGSDLMKVCCGKDNLNPDGSCGKAQWWTGKGFINAPWTYLGRGERFLRSSGISDSLKAQYEAVVGGKPTGGGGGVTPDTQPVPVPSESGSAPSEAARDNTMLIVGGAAVAVAALLLLRRR